MADIIGPGFSENGLKFQNEKEHIFQNVKRILLTRRGEQIGDLSFGSDLQRYLFMPQMMISDVITEVKNSVERCDPRIEVVDCEFIGYDNVTEILDLSITLKNKEKDEIISGVINV